MRQLLILVQTTALILLISVSCTNSGDSGSASSSGPWISSFTVVADLLSDSSGMNFQFSTTDSSGNIYLTANTTGNNTWRVLKSTDQGATWSTSDTNPATYSYGWRIAADSLGNVFAAGATSPDNSNVTAAIRKFNGTSWSTVFTYQAEVGEYAEFNGVAVDSSNNVYVTGKVAVTTPTSIQKAVLFKSTDNGTSWTLINSFSPYEARFAHRTNIIAHGGALYMTGSTTSVAVGSIPATWVRKSTDGGTTWNTIYEAFGTYIEDIVSWNGGLVVIQDYDRGTHDGKIRVLATSNDFQNLTELYSAAPSSPSSAFAADLAVDSRGYLYAAGSYFDTGSVGTAFVSVTRDGATWERLVDKTILTTDLESESPDNIFFGSGNQIYYAAPYTSDGGVTSTLRIYSATINEPTTFALTAIGNGSAKVSPIPSSSKIIYVTTNFSAGDFGVTAADAKTNADAFCNADSNKPTFATGTFKALIAISGQRIGCTTANCGGGPSEHTDWPLAANQLYVTRTGLVFGTTTANGIFASISAANFLAMYAPVLPWNGLDQQAANYWMLDAGGNCSDWASNNSGDFGWTLDPTQTVLGDFYSTGTANWGTCDELRPLVCVEQ